MADKDTPIYDKTRMRGTTWVDATRILFNMGSELEEQVDGMDYEGVKQDLADEISNRQNADTQLGNRITAEQMAREQADSQLQNGINQNKSDITQINETINQIEDNATALGASVVVIQTDVAENKGNIQANSGKIEVLENEYAGFNSEQISLRTGLTEVQADVDGIKTSLVSDVITKAGSTVGTIIVELEREDGTKISAQDFNYGKPTSMELLQGSSEGMMKAQFTLSDGTTIQSNDFQVLEQITGDVYITSFTFKNGSSQGKISAVIGLSDGRTLDANDFQLPTDPQIQSNITNLLSRMNSVEKKNNQQDTDISALKTRMDTAESNIAGNDADIAQLKSEDETIKGDITSLDARVTAIEDTPGVGKFELGKLGTIMGSSDNGKISANPDGTGSVNGWDSVATVDELADYLKKTDAESTYAKKTDVSGIGITTRGNTATVNGKNANIVNSISGRVDENNNLIINVNGINSSPIVIPSGSGVELEELDITNLPTDFKEGDYLIITFKEFEFSRKFPADWNTEPTTVTYDQIEPGTRNGTSCIIRLSSATNYLEIPLQVRCSPSTGGKLTSMIMYTVDHVGVITSWNNPNYSSHIISLNMFNFNGGGAIFTDFGITKAEFSNWIVSMYRIRV